MTYKNSVYHLKCLWLCSFGSSSGSPPASVHLEMPLESSVSGPTCVTDDGIQTFVCVCVCIYLGVLCCWSIPHSRYTRSYISSAQRPRVHVIISPSPTREWLRQPYHIDSIAQTIKPSSRERKPANPENHAGPQAQPSHCNPACGYPLWAQELPSMSGLGPCP